MSNNIWNERHTNLKHVLGDLPRHSLEFVDLEQFRDHLFYQHGRSVCPQCKAGARTGPIQKNRTNT